MPAHNNTPSTAAQPPNPIELLVPSKVDALPDLHGPVPAKLMWPRWDCGMSGPPVEALLSQYLTACRTRVGDPAPHRQVMQAILYAGAQALCTSQSVGERVVVGVSLTKNAYTKDDFDQAIPSYYIIQSMLKWMHANGRIVLSVSAGRGRASWFEPAAQFLAGMNEIVPVVLNQTGVVRMFTARDIRSVKFNLEGQFTRTGKQRTGSRPREHGHQPVRLSTLPEPDIQTLLAVQDDLTRLNVANLARQYHRCDPDNVWRPCPPTDLLLTAVYNDSRLDRGGRLYCGVQNYQQRDTPTPIRETLLIDLKPTVECDFSNLHVRMLLNERGLPLDPDVDVYARPDVDGWVGQDKRVLKKLCMLIMINAVDRASAVRACAIQQDDWLNERVPDGQGGEWVRPRPGRQPIPRKHAGIHALLNAIEVELHPIADQFYTGAGSRLQAIDAKISMAVQLHFLSLGRPCIGIHDSFIVWQEDEPLLRETMRTAYERAYPGFGPKIDTKQKKRTTPGGLARHPVPPIPADWPNHPEPEFITW